MKTFDKVIIASKAALIITLFVAVVLGIGYANAQMFNPLQPVRQPVRCARCTSIRMHGATERLWTSSMRQAESATPDL